MAAARQRGRDAFRGACSHLRCWRMERAVEAHRVEGVKNFMLRIYESEVKKAHRHSPTTRHGLQ